MACRHDSPRRTAVPARDAAAGSSCIHHAPQGNRPEPMLSSTVPPLGRGDERAAAVGVAGMPRRFAETEATARCSSTLTTGNRRQPVGDGEYSGTGPGTDGGRTTCASAATSWLADLAGPPYYAKTVLWGFVPRAAGLDLRAPWPAAASAAAALATHNSNGQTSARTQILSHARCRPPTERTSPEPRHEGAARGG
jgi:hypothetical protein